MIITKVLGKRRVKRYEGIDSRVKPENDEIFIKFRLPFRRCREYRLLGDDT